MEVRAAKNPGWKRHFHRWAEARTAPVGDIAKVETSQIPVKSSATDWQKREDRWKASAEDLQLRQVPWKPSWVHGKRRYAS
jgi:hypothetical protein